MTSHRFLLTSMLAPLALAAGTAHAQSAPASTPQADAEAIPESKGLEEIVVTSQRRAEKLQSVPVTVSAFN